MITMPTAANRRRSALTQPSYCPSSIRLFAEIIGVGFFAEVDGARTQADDGFDTFITGAVFGCAVRIGIADTIVALTLAGFAFVVAVAACSHPFFGHTTARRGAVFG